VVVLEAGPVYRFTSARLAGGEAVATLPVMAGLGGAAAVTGLVVVVSLLAGIRRVRSMEG